MNQYDGSLIQTKLRCCSVPTGVFTSLLTLLSQAVTPLIYYGMVIGWGVAVTPSRRIMNHVGQNISLCPVTPKEVITRGRKRFWWSTAALKSLLWRCRSVLFPYSCCLFHGVKVNATLTERSRLTKSLHATSKCSSGWKLNEDLLSLQLVMWGPSCCMHLVFALAFGSYKESWIAPSKGARQCTKIWRQWLCCLADVMKTISGAAGRWRRHLRQEHWCKMIQIQAPTPRWTRWEKKVLGRLEKMQQRTVGVMTTAIIFINLCLC